MKKRLILIGGGGHCKSVIDVIEQGDEFKIEGVIDSDSTIIDVLGYPVLGGDRLIPTLVNKNTYFLITVGQIKSFSIRFKIASLLNKYNAQLATIISPLAYVSRHAQINQGTVIMHRAFVNAASEVGKHCIINSFVNIEHDVRIEDYCHISTCAVVNGGVTIKHGTFIGSNATIINNIVIAESVIVGAATSISKDITQKGVYVGVPAKRISKKL